MKLSSEYIRGLVEGEGTFTFHTVGRSEPKKRVPAFVLRMHHRDQALLEGVRDHLHLNTKVHVFRAYQKDGANRAKQVALTVRGIGNLKNTVVPFFHKKLRGNKGKQFADWLEKIGSDPSVLDGYKIISRLYKAGYWDRAPFSLD